MQYAQVLFDADGVLVDSRAHAWEAARRIFALFNYEAEIDCMRSYRHHFGRVAQGVAAEEHHVATLRALHRLMMRHRSRDLPLFDDVIKIASLLVVPCSVVTSALGNGIRAALGKDAAIFKEISGNEVGNKADILPRLLQDSPAIYVTDSVRDIAICCRLAVPAVAVGWGYDALEDLIAAGSDYAVASPQELATLFGSFGLL
jgi:phosphoglycolate phosphatase-like HAD superfamily hydrolase